VQLTDDQLEWVESPDAIKVVRRRDQSLKRPDEPQRDITFRMARTAPGG
jgi:hypothetical protein